MKQHQVHIVPAQPGWVVLEPVWNDDKVTDFTADDVIAWKVKTWLEVDIAGERDFGEKCSPITLHGHDSKILRSPTGRILIPEEYDFESMESLTKHLNAERAKTRADWPGIKK